MSLEVPNSLNPSSTTYQLMETAIDYATAKGALLVAAAGNYGSNPSDSVAYPARFVDVMAVAALSYDSQRASYSSDGAIP